MCRYAIYGPYKEHFACFSCRKVFKQERHAEAPAGSAITNQREHKCPQCGVPMADMGLDFKAPKMGDTKQWQKVKILFDHGFTFHSCGCCGPGFRPAELKDVYAFIEGQRSKTEGEVLLQKIQLRVAARDAASHRNGV